MKNTILKIFLFIVVLFAFVVIHANAESEIINPGDENYASTIQSIAVQLFENMDFQANPNLEPIHALYINGQYDEALTQYKKYWFPIFGARCEKGVMGLLGNTQSWLTDVKSADKLVDSNTVTITDRSNHTKDLYLGKLGNYNWGLETTEVNDDSSIFAEYTNMYFTGCLVGSYANQDTCDVKYLDKWLDIWLDYDMNFALKGNAVSLARQQWVYSGFISCLKLERYNGAHFTALNMMYQFNPEQIVERMNNVQFGYMLLRALDRLEQVNLYINQPNQSITGSQAAVNLYCILTDFKSAYQRMLVALERFQYNQNRNFIPDGTDVEHDMKYNKGYISNTLMILKCLDACEIEHPSYMTELLKNCVTRMRALLSCKTSDGAYPNIADTFSDTWIPYQEYDNYNRQISNDELTNRLLATFSEDETALKPAFTSIAFPFNGYYLMRSDWSKNAQWMFFMGSRWSGGHSCDCNLSVMLFDRGERLLIDSGGDGYGEMAIGDYLIFSYAHNTLSVDDLTQAWMFRDLIDTTDSRQDASKPLDGLWYTDDTVDLATGTYKDGYSSNTGHWLNNVSPKEVTDVVHNRSVLQDKENEISVVYDRINSHLKHTMNINWNFAKKFNDYGTVLADADEKTIKTNLNDGLAGIDIYNFTQNDIRYELNCGEYGDSDGQLCSGWCLPTYGVDFKPIMHVSTYFDGNCSKQGVLSLLVPKSDNESSVDSVKAISDNQGFELIKKDGTKIICIGGQDDSTPIRTDGFDFSAKLFYLVQRTDGSGWGIVNGAAGVVYNGKTYRSGNSNFHFTLQNGKLIIDASVTIPRTFQWVDTPQGTVPYYGDDSQMQKQIRY